MSGKKCVEKIHGTQLKFANTYTDEQTFTHRMLFYDRWNVDGYGKKRKTRLANVRALDSLLLLRWIIFNAISSREQTLLRSRIDVFHFLRRPLISNYSVTLLQTKQHSGQSSSMCTPCSLASSNVCVCVCCIPYSLEAYALEMENVHISYKYTQKANRRINNLWHKIKRIFFCVKREKERGERVKIRAMALAHYIVCYYIVNERCVHS